MKKNLLALILALAMCLPLAGCGSSDTTDADDSTVAQGTDSATDSATDSTDDSTTDSADDVVAELTDLEAIQAKGEMIIGYTVYEPMNYTNDDNEFVGFDTELAIAVCEALGVTPVFQEINWDTKEIELAAGTIDCVWNGLTITEERQENMEITAPYVVNAQVVIMRADNDYVDTSSLADADICAEAGSAGQTTIEEDASLSQATFISKTLQTECLMEVAGGFCDAAVLDITLAQSMIGEGTDYSGLVIVDQLAEEYYGVAFRKGSDVAAATNAIFVALMADGTMGDLADTYGLTLAD